MAYQVLARKWRPQTFSSLVGQGAIVTSLRNALNEGRIAQAYLFSGIRGVGKTTSARLLAKALNCEQGPTPEPCNQCQPCIEITAGGDLDVIEIDAATYSKVEQVRELTESLRYGPARDRYKVVILDEIHRLSRQAFDALLKIVEEPPPHLVFIFATTELEAVPATVLSRCQQFRFRRVTAQDLAAHLGKIAAEENLTVSDAALYQIARAGEGSVRDSVALLDQLATFGAGTIEDEDAARLSGGFDTSAFHGLLSNVLAGRSAEISQAIGQLETEGWEPRHVYAQFLAFCRDALHLSLGASPDQVELPKELAAELATLARDAGYENLLRLVQLLLSAESTVRRSEAGALAVEIALLRAAELPKLTSVERFLAQGGGGGPAAPAGGGGGRPGQRPHGGGPGYRAGANEASAPSAAASAASLDAEPTSPAPRNGRAVNGAVVNGHHPDEPPESGPGEPPPSDAPPFEPPPEELAPMPNGPGTTTGDPASFPRALIARLQRSRPPLAAHLSAARRMEMDDGRLILVCPPGDSLLERALERGNNRDALVAEAEALGFPRLRWSIVVEEVSDESMEQRSQEDLRDSSAKLPRVRAVLDTFRGHIESVEPRQSRPSGG